MLDSDVIPQLVDEEGSSSLSIYERRRNIPPDDYVIDSGCSCTHTWTVAVSIPLIRPVPLGTLMRCLR